MNAVFLTTPSPKLRGFREEIVSSFGASQEAAQLFYLSTVFSASREAESLLDRGYSVVIDRYFLSTQAYAEYRGSLLRVDHLQALLMPADLTVLLHAPLATRRARLLHRGSASAADAETLSASADAQLRASHASRLDLAVLGRVLEVDRPAKCRATRAMRLGRDSYRYRPGLLAAVLRLYGYASDQRLLGALTTN